MDGSAAATLRDAHAVRAAVDCAPRLGPHGHSRVRGQGPASEDKVRHSTVVEIQTPEQIARMREACRIGREVLDLAGRAVKPGVTTEAIDVLVHEACIARNAYPSPLNYRDFPKSCCTSVNEIICHGIPDARPLQDGDIVNIDISVYHQGMHADLNETFCVGSTVPAKHKLLIKATHDALLLAIREVKPETLYRDLGNTITKHVSAFGMDVVRAYCGHGVASLFHCNPSIPHYAGNKAIGKCKPGTIFTIEPMINLGRYKDVTWPDEWTSATEDGLASAQFEHTMVVTDTGVCVLTPRTANSVPHWWEADPASIATVTREALGENWTEKKAALAALDLRVDPVSGMIVEVGGSSDGTAGAGASTGAAASNAGGAGAAAAAAAANEAEMGKKKKKLLAKKAAAAAVAGAGAAANEDAADADE